jgi:hypothetical protein
VTHGPRSSVPVAPSLNRRLGGCIAAAWGKCRRKRQCRSEVSAIPQHDPSHWAAGAVDRGLPSLTPRSFACASAALVLAEISPASSSATAAMIAMTELAGGSRRYLRQIADTAFARALDDREQEHRVAGEPVELGDDQGRALGPAGRERGGEGRAGIVLPALHFLEGFDQTAADRGDVLLDLLLLVGEAEA